MIKTTLTIMLLSHISLSSNLSFFVERESTIGGSDYVNVFIEDSNNQNQKLVYKLPQAFRNKEVFRLKICKKGTVAQVNLENPQQLEELVNENCLHDVYNTRSIIDYDERLMLEELHIYNVYKICIFGFTFPEIEKSFMSVPLSRFSKLTTHDLLDDNENLYFLDSSKIAVLMEEDSKGNFRNDFNKESNNRCHLKYNLEENFETSKFQKESTFLSSETSKSYLLIEYDFEENLEINIPNVEEYESPSISTEKKIRGRENIIQSLEKDFVIKENKNFNTVINFSVFKNGQEEINVDEFEVDTDLTNMEGQGVHMKISFGEEGSFSNEFQGYYNLPIDNNKFVRFFPLVCYEKLNQDKEYSYEFIGDHSCIPISENKIILAKLNGGFSFFKQDKTISQNSQHQFDTMQLVMAPKDNLNEKIIISGFENQCDGVFDQFASVFYFVCYQKTTVDKKLNNFRILKGSKILNYNFELLENSTVKKNKAARRTNDHAGQISAYITAALFALSMICLLFISSVFGWILFFIFLIAFAFTFFLKSNRGNNLWILFKPAEVEKMRRNTLNKNFYIDKQFRDQNSQNMIIVDSSQDNLLAEGELRQDLEEFYFPIEKAKVSQPIVEKSNINSDVKTSDENLDENLLKKIRI